MGWRGGGGGGGGYAALQSYSVAYEETQSNRVSDFCDFVCSLFPKAILFYFNCIIEKYFSSVPILVKVYANSCQHNITENM